MTSAVEFKVNLPDRERAHKLALLAMNSTEQGDLSSAIAHIEEAITLDRTAALNGFQWWRAELHEMRGQLAAKKSIEMYNHAAYLKKCARFRDATMAYQESATLDSTFLWPLNNLAWMLSTNNESSVRNGPKAVKYALDVCEKSNWNCWSFLGTLAAAFAEAGDFRRAVGWQEASLPLVPEDHRLDAELMLRHFERGHAYIDEGLPVAAGSSGEVLALNAPDILRPEQISVNALRDLFEAGSLSTVIDSDESLWIIDRLRVLVKPAESGGLIVLITVAGRTTHADTEACLQLVNRINASKAGFLRAAYCDDVEKFVFDYTIPVGDGIARQAVVDVARAFVDSLLENVSKVDIDGLVARNTCMFKLPD